MDKDKHIIVDELKRTLYKDIELQEQVRLLFKKILRRLSILFVTLTVVTISMLTFIIYFLTRPAPASEITIKAIDDWNRIILAQRGFVQDDRKDVAAAREQVTFLVKTLDSLIKAKQ